MVVVVVVVEAEVVAAEVRDKVEEEMPLPQ